MRDQQMPRSDEPSPLEVPAFGERVEFLTHAQWWPTERIQRFQVQQLRYILWHASTRVPFYREMFRGLKLSWTDFHSLDDLRRLPSIGKADIQADYDAFIPDGIDRSRLYHRSTGGSTGSPLTVYMDLDHLARDKAQTEFYMNVAGLDIFSHRSVRLYGDRIPKTDIDAGRYWYVQDGRRLVMSCYHFEANTVPQYVKAMEEFQPVYVHTRPSAILPLARYILRLGIAPRIELRGVFCDGEFLTEGQRSMIEQALDTRVFNVFGHTEGCVAGFSCAESRYLHFIPHSGTLEIIKTNGKPARQDGERGEMVVTGFNNRCFPLIRYRTGDVGVMAAGPCACGRQFPLLYEVEGRVQDYVVRSGGGVVPLAPAVFNYNDFDWKGIKEFRVVQDEPGKLLFNVQVEGDESQPHCAAERVKVGMEKLLGGGFQVEVQLVDSIERTAIGKLRYLDQRLDISEYMQES